MRTETKSGHDLVIGVFVAVFLVTLMTLNGDIDVVGGVKTLLQPPPDQHFSGCEDARGAGRENIPASDPSYRPAMDGDSDGIACERYR